MSGDLERSVKDRVKEIAKREGRTFNDVWKSLVLERFLARLARSSSVEKLIFKGGVLLSKYLPLGRETVDLDFLLRNATGSVASITDLVKAVLAVPFDDGFTFDTPEVVELPQPHMNYPGYEVTTIGVLGGTRTSIRIDLGVGDVIEPTRKTISLLALGNKPLFESEIALEVYPLSYIFAEKLETVVYRGATNSRMKDFYDLWILRNHPETEITKIAGTIRSVFLNRETQIPESFELSARAIEGLEKDWKRFIQTLPEKSQKAVPSNLSEILELIRSILMDVRAGS